MLIGIADSDHGPDTPIVIINTTPDIYNPNVLRIPNVI